MSPTACGDKLTFKRKPGQVGNSFELVAISDIAWQVSDISQKKTHKNVGIAALHEQFLPSLVPNLLAYKQ